MLYNRSKFFIKPRFYDFGNRLPVFLLGVFIADSLQILLRSVHMRCKRSLRKRADIAVDHVRDFIGVGNHHFLGTFFSEIGKFFKHLLSSSEIYSGILVCIGKFHPLEKNFTVNLIMLIEKMCVTGSNNRLSKLVSERDQFTVKLAQILVGGSPAARNQISVVTDRLNLYVVIIRRNFKQIRSRSVLKHGIKQFSLRTGRTDNKPLAVIIKHGFRYSRMLLIIIKIAEGNKLIKILKSDLILDKDYHMIGLQLQAVNLIRHCRSHCR